MLPQPNETMTERQYLEIEGTSKEKHEFINGCAYSMAGGSPRHAMMQLQVGIALGSRLRGGPCKPLSSDARVHIPTTQAYVYPDLTIVCGRPETAESDPNAITNPTVIVEILSQSTADFDRGAKFGHYRRIASLQEYVVIDQSTPHVLHHRRTASGQWLLTEISSIEDSVALPGLDCEVPLAEIYDGYLDYPGDAPPA